MEFRAMQSGVIAWARGGRRTLDHTDGHIVEVAGENQHHHDEEHNHPRDEEHHHGYSDHDSHAEHGGCDGHDVEVDLTVESNRRMRNGLLVGMLGSFALAGMNRYGADAHGMAAQESAYLHELADGVAHTLRVGSSYMRAWGQEKGERALRRVASVGVLASGVMAAKHGLEGVSELISDPSQALEVSLGASRYAVVNKIGNLAMAGVLIKSSLGTVLEHDVGDHAANDAQEGIAGVVGTFAPPVGEAMLIDAAAQNAKDGALRAHNPDYVGDHGHNGRLARAKNAVFGGITRQSLRATMWAMARTQEAHQSLSTRGKFVAAGLGALAIGGGVALAQQGVDTEPMASMVGSDLLGSPALEPQIPDVSGFSLAPELPLEVLPSEVPDFTSEAAEAVTQAAPEVAPSEMSFDEWMLEWGDSPGVEVHDLIEFPDSVELPTYDHETRDGTVWNIARDFLGPEASNAEISDLKNAILSHNNLTEEGARGLHPGVEINLRGLAWSR